MGIEEWQSDIDITVETVKRVLQEQMPGFLPIQSIHLLGAGWDNRIFLVNDNLVFRFPHRRASVPLMQRESLILGNMPAFREIRTPRLKYAGQPASKFPFPFQVYEIINGQSGYRAGLDQKERSDNIGILAGFLKQLHEITPDDAKRMGAIAQGSGSRTNIEETIKVLMERTDKIVQSGGMKINLACLRDEINQAKNLTLPDTHCLVHGDLDSRHLIFDEKKLVGIIDWGDTDIANRSVDLDIVWTFFSVDCHDKFLKIYGAVEEDEWRFARFLGLYCSFSLALYANDLNDSLLLSESVDSIKRINPDILKS